MHACVGGVTTFAMKNRPLLIIAFAGAIILWAAYHTLGGIEGIRADPYMSLAVFAITLLICFPVFWFRYRRMQREPIYEAVPEPAPDAALDILLDNTPIVIVSSRLKMLVLLVVLVLAIVVSAAMVWTQPGVCRVGGMVVTAPFFGFAVLTGLIRLVMLERLEITPEGLRHTSFGWSRFWPWGEIRDLTLIRARGAFSWISGITFNRFSPEQHAAGPARVVLRPTWRMASDKLADLLNRARLRWSSPLASTYVPVKKSFAHYAPMVLTWLFACGMLYLLMVRPCG